MSSVTVAVTGAAGFLGRRLVPRLAEDGAIGEVVAIDQVSGADSAALGDRVRWIRADVRDPALHETLRGCDVVVHLAFVVLGDLREAESVNVAGSANVFEAAARAGCRRVVFLSSVAAYGFGSADGHLLTEDEPLRPIPAFTYSRTKAAAEAALDATAGRHPDLEVVRLRPSIILGSGAHAPLLRWAGSRIHVAPGRTGPLQFVHLDDVVEACRLATVGDHTTDVFNLAGAGSITFADLADLARAWLIPLPGVLARAAVRLASRIRPAAGLDVGWLLIARRPPLVATGRAETDLGWRPTRTTREAAQEFLAAARDPEQALEVTA